MKILSHKIEELSNLKYSALITVECDCCHAHFQKNRRTIEINIRRNSKHFFCNQKCRHDFYSSLVKKSDYNCLECGNKVIRSQSQIEKSGNIFCSHKCAATYSNKIRYKNHIYKQKKKEPKQLILQLRQNKQTKKIETVSLKNFQMVCLCNCAQCNIDLARTKYQLSDKKNKNKLVFCSRSCRMTYQNLNNPKKYGCRKSKAEIYLFNLIKSDFPLLNILENDRTILKSKLEIDLYIPELKLAIELNGPVHYIPIFGEDRLKKCQNRDLLKQQEINQIGISLIVIDISRLNSKKKTEEFLIEYYNSHIKPILNGSSQPFKVIPDL